MTIPWRSWMAVCVAAWSFPGLVLAQSANQSSAQSPYYGSVTIVEATSQTKQISLDEAVRMGLDQNLALTEARAQEKAVRAQVLDSLQPLLPTVTAQADTGAHQVNLAAIGFSPSVLKNISKLFPEENFSNVSLIVKDDVTDAMVNYSQTLFNLSTIDQYRSAKAQAVGAFYNTQSSRGLVVLNVGTAYLEALAAGARVDNAKALLHSDQVTLDQTVAQHQAGTAANLDELRARVQFESQQQSVIARENDFEKAKIALNREIGLPAEQPIQLTDAAPYSELADMSVEDAKQLAYRSRQDYQGIQARIRAAELEKSAAKWERLPSLSFDGNYGVTGVTHELYHGTFIAAGTINVPLFEEAKLRGDSQVASAKLTDLREQFADLKAQIDQQVRDSLLDVESSKQLVQVAQSNVDLAQQTLDQTTQRFAAGVDDNLPVVEAQARLAAAEANLVNTTVGYNEAKLGLARNLGIIDTQYKSYLHGK